MIRLARLAGLALAGLTGCGMFSDGPDLSTKDEICGVPGLITEARAPVTGPGACGIEEPVTVISAAGVRLSKPSIMTCETAVSLDNWLREGAIPAVGKEGGGLRELTVAAHYACRTRNNRRGARLSEHAKGKAIDISGIVYKNGTRLNVLEGWNQKVNGQLLRKLHSSACGPFGTVLGPNSDRFHRDHFHFDTASYRSGPYCR